MAPLKKRIRKNSSRVDEECLEQLKLLYVCGYCTKLVGNNEKNHIEHAKSHENEIKQCRTCIIPLKPSEIQEHLSIIHPANCNRITLRTDKSIIELRIAAGKGFSNFWGICLSSTDPALDRFASVTSRWWNNFKNGRSIGVFRVYKSKIHWKCSICERKSASIFGDTITMRAYAISHLEQFHFDEIIENMPGFFEFEWFHLNEEVDFNVRALMNIAEQRLKQMNRSYWTFYTVNLNKMQNGLKFTKELKKRNRIENENVRFCLICCSILPVDSVKHHFRSLNHEALNAIPQSTSFLQVNPSTSENPIESQSENSVMAMEEESFEFPKELFLYSKVYKNLRRDEFKWRCCLCPRAHSLTFATQIVMRMHALRHIEQNHKFLFTEEFLTFEWESLQHEMRASFDIRHFIPLQYTIKGEDTFNGRDPNDYILPQQYYFLPKEYIKDTVICGFCYRSLSRVNFFLHITIHGFCVDQSDFCELRPVILDIKVRELMGQNNYLDVGLDDEPHTILSIDGKRLKVKMDAMNARRSNMSRLSDITTPAKSERDTDGEMATPRSRKSAMDARRLLTETFKILQENARNRNDTWNSSSSSSSSDDDDDSDEERFERNLDIEATTRREREERERIREKSRERSREQSIGISREEFRESTVDSPRKSPRESPSDSPRDPSIEPPPQVKKTLNASKMRPAEIREWIKREAMRKGIQLKEDSDDLTSSDDDMDSGEKTPPQMNNNKWANMKLKDIKKKIRQAAKRKNVALSSESSSSNSSDSDDD